MKTKHLLVVITLLTLCGCVDNQDIAQSARPAMTENIHTQRMVVLPQPPNIVATKPGGIPAAIRAAAKIDPTEVASRESARWVSVDALPFLTSTEPGQEFLAAANPRALARGVPPEFCPVVAVASGVPGSPSDTVAGAALGDCLAKLDPKQHDCGCRIVALDDLIMVPREQTAYATGTSARMRSASLGIDLLLIAEAVSGGETLLRDVRGTVAHLAYGDKNKVTLTFDSTGRQFDGYRIPVGFRRGRVAERIYATDAAGNRLSLLIGFEPDELAGGAGAWLAWPSEG